MLSGYEGERGQILVLFTVIFSVILVLAAFAIDQGFWYGRRRIAQRQADLSARAGAPAFFASLSNTAGAASAANAAAQANGVASGSVNASADNNCLGKTLPSVHVNVSSHAPGLFTSLGLTSNDTTGVNAEARSTACIGSVQTLRATAQAGSTFEQGLVLALARDNGRSSSFGAGQPCFSGGTLRLGQECVIYEAGSTRSAAFRAPGNARNCDDRGFRANQVDNELEDGAGFTCTTASGSCTSACVALDNDPTDVQHVRSVLDGLARRLQHTNANCSTLEEPNSLSFQNAFGNADADPSLAPDPPGLGGSAPGDYVYVQNDCFSNRRIGVMPIVDSTNSSRVRGFATVYITGCYHFDQGTNGAGEREDCDAAARDPNPCDDDGNNGNGNGNRNCHDCPDECGPDRWQVRAIPIRVYVSTDSVGDIVAPTANAPLTMQTVQ